MILFITFCIDLFWCRPSKNTTMFVWVTLVITLIRFVSPVIWDITNYLGVAFITVKKKDK